MSSSCSCYGLSVLLLLLLLLLLLPAVIEGQDVRKGGVSAEEIKENIDTLYRMMGSPEISPKSASGTLNVSVSISNLLLLRSEQLELSLKMDLRWHNNQINILEDDTLEAIPLNRDKLWTPKFVFVNVRSIREDQNSLYLHLSGATVQSRAIVYVVWYSATISCESAGIQHPFSDILCNLVFEQPNPLSARSVHMSLGHRHQYNCTEQHSLGRSFVYRLSKRFSNDGRKFQFWTRICIRTNLEEMTPVLRQYCVSLLLVLFSLSTIYCFDRSTRLLVNVAVLHLLIFNWAPLSTRVNAVDIWNAKCTFISCCCLLVSLATCQRSDGAGGSGAGGGGGGAGHDLHNRNRFSHNGTFLLQKEFGGGGGARTSKCTTISESTDNLDLFDTRRSPTSDAGVGNGGSSSSSIWHKAVKVILPLWWLAFAAAFWATVLLTAAGCETLLPECFVQ